MSKLGTVAFRAITVIVVFFSSITFVFYFSRLWIRIGHKSLGKSFSHLVLFIPGNEYLRIPAFIVRACVRVKAIGGKKTFLLGKNDDQQPGRRKKERNIQLLLRAGGEGKKETQFLARKSTAYFHECKIVFVALLCSQREESFSVRNKSANHWNIDQEYRWNCARSTDNFRCVTNGVHLLLKGKKNE